jgi:hypothetical protein
MSEFCPDGIPSVSLLCNIWFQAGLVLCVLAPIVIVGWVYGRIAWQLRRSTHLRTHGTQAIGVVRQYRIFVNTPNGVVGRIPVELSVVVSPRNAPQYEAQCVVTIDAWKVTNVHPGRTLKVWYDPQRPADITVDV